MKFTLNQYTCEYCKVRSTAMNKKYIEHFPFEIRDVEPEILKELRSKCAVDSGFVRVGPKGYFNSMDYKSDSALYYNMVVRPSDVFLTGVPRSGTTILQEMLWLIGNDFDYEKAARVKLLQRFPLFEQSNYRSNPTISKKLNDKFKGNEGVLQVLSTITQPVIEYLSDAPSPRFIKTHLPLSLLPPALADTARVVYVARDPRDVAVSFFHLSRSSVFIGFNGDFKLYWNYFIKDLISYLPYFEHVKEGWEKRNHTNVLFLFYEELVEDMPGTIKKVAKFLKKSITEEQVTKLTDHLKLENFKKNQSVNRNFLRDIGLFKPDEQSFIRNGKVGGWRDYFDEQMTRQADHWIAENLRGTDLRFPSMNE